MPNVTGTVYAVSETFNTSGSADGVFARSGSRNAGETPSKVDSSHAGHFNMYLNRGSNQYIGGLKEVRVKSVISNGFIKLY